MSILNLTIHRGTKEIGGNCVSLESEKTRIVIDYGAPLFEEHRKSFDMKKTLGVSIQKLISLGVLHPIKGLYKDDGNEFAYNKDNKVDAVLVSHAHADHIGFLHYVSEKIPVYIGDGAERIISASNVFLFGPKIRNMNFKKIKGPKCKTVTIGDFKVTPIPVDHSAYDSYAYLINYKSINILYTGDFRVHGRKYGMYKEMLKKLKDIKLDYLIVEGTHMEKDSFGRKSEEDIEEENVNTIERTSGLVLANFSPLNIDRFISFFKAAKRTGRKLVIDEYCAFVLHMISNRQTIPTPKRDTDIKVYFRKSFLEKRNGLKNKMLKLFGKYQVDSRYINKNQQNLVMLFRPSMIDTDFKEIVPAKGSDCIYSYSGIYLKKPEYRKLVEYCNRMGIEFGVAHVSGHIYLEDMKDFINTVRPRHIIPIHTFCPEEFAKHFPNVIQLNDGEPFNISAEQDSSFFEKYADVLKVNYDALPGATFEERLEYINKNREQKEDPEDMVANLCDPNPRVRQWAAFGLYILNDFRSLSAIYGALEKEDDRAAALNMTESALFMNPAATDKNLHRLLNKNLHPNARWAIETILKKWSLL